MASRSSTFAGVHPYLKPNFVWPEIEHSKNLGRILTDEEFEELIIPEYRKKRTFYFNEAICKIWGLNYYEKGETLIVKRDDILNFTPIVLNLGVEQHKRLCELKDEVFKFVNNGLSWWTAETLWIKMK